MAATDIAAVTKNGHESGPPPGAPVMPKRIRELPMPDEYGAAGMTLKVWINYPNWMGDDIFSNNAEALEGEHARLKAEWIKAQNKRPPRQSVGSLEEEYELFEWPGARADIRLRRRYDALSQIVLEHNGWWDPVRNQQYSPANTRAFWDEIPNELAVSIFSLIGLEMTKLPNSLVATNSTSTPT